MRSPLTHRTWSNFGLLLLAVLTLTLPSFAATVKWVDAASGNDANDGNTEATAYATLQRAIDESESGTGPSDRSFIHVKDGAYETLGLQNLGGFETVLLIADLDWLTIRAADGHEPVVRPTGTGRIVGISIDACEHLVLENIDVDQTTTLFDCCHVRKSEDLTIRGGVFEAGEDGIDFEDGMDGIRLEGCVFKNILSGLDDEALELKDGSFDNLTIEGCRFENNKRHVRVGPARPGATFTNITIRRNLFLGTSATAGIRLVDVTDALVENNVIAYSAQQGLYIDGATASATIRHNTFFRNGEEQLRTKLDSAALVVENNVFYSNGVSAAISAPTAGPLPGENHNLTFDEGSATEGSEVAVTSFGPSSLPGVDPGLVDTQAGTLDLRTGTGSPARAAGIERGVTDDLLGNARPHPALTPPDLGAYETTPTQCRTEIEELVLASVEPSTFESSDAVDRRGLVIVHYNSGTDLQSAGAEDVAFYEILGAQLATSGSLDEPWTHALHAVVMAPTADGSNLPPDLRTVDSESSDFGEPPFGDVGALWTLDRHDGANAPGDLVGARFHTLEYGDVCEWTTTLPQAGPTILDAVLRVSDGIVHEPFDPEVDISSGTFLASGDPAPGVRPAREFRVLRMDLDAIGSSNDGTLMTGTADPGFVGVWRVASCGVAMLGPVGVDVLTARVTSPRWINSSLAPFVTVEVSMGELSRPVSGYQAWLDVPGGLSFVSGTYTDAPFGLPLVQPIEMVGSEVALAAGVDFAGGESATLENALLATLQFDASGLPTGTSIRITIDPDHVPPTRFTDESGQALDPTLGDPGEIRVDNDAPVIVLPDDVFVTPVPGECEVTLDPGVATVTDTLDPHPRLSGARDDGMALTDPYPAGVTTVTWTAVDRACNVAIANQIVTVREVNDLEATVELAPTIASAELTRCITLEAWPEGCDKPVVIEQDVTFVDGVGSLTVELPCGSYECVTVRDRKHTLGRAVSGVDIAVDEDRYVVDFTADAETDRSLVGGNLNDDAFIDILDFGIFVANFGEDLGDGSSLCGEKGSHPDVNGDGLVTTADFTFVIVNFFRTSDETCCTSGATADRPRKRIRVSELIRRGMNEAAIGDLNRDGWLDRTDVKAFLDGVRPPSRKGLGR